MQAKTQPWGALVSRALLIMSAPAYAASAPALPMDNPDTQHAVMVGRFDTSQPRAVRFSLPGSKLGVSFTGPRLDIFLGDTGHDAINVRIDDGAPQSFILRPSGIPLRYTLAQNLSAGKHTAWVTKRTEAFASEMSPPFRHTGTLTFSGFAIARGEAFLVPPPTKPHTIETVGDSGYTGYAVDQIDNDPQRHCEFRVTSQNADLSVPTLLGQRLNSEVINSSASGVGIFDSPWDPKKPEHMLPAVYRALVPPHPTPEYTGTHQAVDAVIIDGGANDVVGEGDKSALIDRAGYVEAYLGLLRRARRQHPHAMLFCVLSAGPIGHDRLVLKEAISEVVSKFRLHDDKRIVMADYFENDPNGWQNIHDAEKGLDLQHACQRHRSPKGAAFLADRLASIVSHQMGW